MSYNDFIVPGFDWHSPEFQIKSNGAPLSITGWTLAAQFFWRGANSNPALSPTNVLIDITSASESMTITDAALGKFEFDLSSDLTATVDASPTKLSGPGSVITCRLSRVDSGTEFLGDIKIPVKF